MSFFLSFFGLKLTPWWEAGWCCVVSQPPALRHLLLGLQPVFLLPLDAQPSAPPPTWAPPLRLQSWGAEQRRSAVEGLGSVAPEEGVQAGRAPERPEEGSPGHQESSPGQQRGPRRGAGRGSVQDGRWCAMDGYLRTVGQDTCMCPLNCAASSEHMFATYPSYSPRGGHVSPTQPSGF